MTNLGRENVQSYPRPPGLDPVPQRIMIQLGGALASETNRALRVLETHHAPSYYLPPEDIHATLRPVQGGSFCEWKGVARYFDVIAGDKTASRAAWCYDRPTAGYAALAGYVAFSAGLMPLWGVSFRVAMAASISASLRAATSGQCRCFRYDLDVTGHSFQPKVEAGIAGMELLQMRDHPPRREGG